MKLCPLREIRNMLTKDAAICIRVIDYSETSQIATFFTKNTGKISTIAKGSKRPKSAFEGPIEILSYGQIVFSQRSSRKLAILTEFQQQPAFAVGYALRDTEYQSSFFVLNCSFFAAELINQLTDEYDPHPQLFDSFLQFLQNTSALRDALHTSRDTLAMLILFQLALLKEIGLQPILNVCANCKNRFAPETLETYFSSAANGLICRDCEAAFPDRIKVVGTAGGYLVNLKLMADAEEKVLNEIEKILISHFTELLGRPPKMAKYILKKVFGP